MSNSEGFECGNCGRSFDTERGLHIHQAQKHPEPEEPPEEPEREPAQERRKEPETGADITIPLSTKQAVLASFLIGIFVGGFFIATIAGFTGMTGAVSSGDNAQAGDNPANTPDETFKSLAEQVGADVSAFETCYQDASGSELSEDVGQIQEVDGQLGTPTIYIGNTEDGFVKVEGAQPYSSLKPLIESELQKATSNSGEEENNRVMISEDMLEGEPTVGSADAPVTIVEYSDFGCPWCAEWAGYDAIGQRPIDEEDTVNKIKALAEEGDVRFVFKDYPVQQLHPNAPKAHIAANCIYEQDSELFWDYHDLLFENRNSWTRAGR